MYTVVYSMLGKWGDIDSDKCSNTEEVYKLNDTAHLGGDEYDDDEMLVNMTPCVNIDYCTKNIAC